MKTNYISALVAKATLAMVILVATATAHAQTFTTLKSFTSDTNGSSPSGGLTLSDGMLYGVSGGGGISNAGTIFKLSTNGSGFSVIHYFSGGSEGSGPIGRVAVSGDTIYGVTYRGGTNESILNGGTIYRVNTNGGSFSILRRLNIGVGDGTLPMSGLVLSGTTLCGVAQQGGVSARGVVYKISTNGSGYQNPHLFTGYADGLEPKFELTLIGGTLFGTTFYSQFGGTGPTLFTLGVDGTGFTVLYTFPITFSLSGRLTPVGSALYGVGYDYNASKSSIYKINTNGSGFQIISQLPAGSTFSSGLTWTGSDLLGAWSDDAEAGRIFQIKTNGSGYHVLGTFGSSDGSGAVIDLVLDGSVVYGTTRSSLLTTNSLGTVFSFDVRPRLATATAGANVKLSWPSYAQDYQLEQNPALTPGGWSNVIAAPSDDGTNRSITVSSTLGNRFFRLHRP